MRLGVDPRKADQMVRGTVNLPHGTGKTARVIVFATGDKAAEAEAAGADVVGARRPDRARSRAAASTSTPPSPPRTRWPRSAASPAILGPRGLMPNPKTGTVTPDVAKAVNDIKGGKIDFRVDKQSNLHLVIGKASFPTEQLVENYAAALDEVLRAKPSAAKGRYLKKVTVLDHDGPGHPGRPEPHPQPAGGREPARLISPLRPHPVALWAAGCPSSAAGAGAGCRSAAWWLCCTRTAAKPPCSNPRTAIRAPAPPRGRYAPSRRAPCRRPPFRWRPGQRRGRAREPRCRSGLHHPVELDDRAPRLHMRMVGDLAERRRRRHARLGAVEDGRPLVARAGREGRGEPLPEHRARAPRPGCGSVDGSRPSSRRAAAA